MQEMITGSGLMRLAIGAFIVTTCASATFAADWTMAGADIHNTRSADSEHKISTANAAGLKQKWAFVTHGDVSATPTVEGNKVYAVDWGGYLYSLDRDTGVPNWSVQLKSYTGNTVGSVARTSPTIVDDTLIIGDQGDTGASGSPQGGGQTASVMAINKHNGKLVWRTVVSDHPYSCITSSPVVDDGVIYVGVSSLEENAGFDPTYIYSWRGKVVALDAHTGCPIWNKPFTTIDDQAYSMGYTGASVWGSTPVIDEKRGLLYVGTGNNYSTPAGGPTTPTSANPAPAGDHFDSILALDLETGHLKWAFRAWPGDRWDVATWIKSGYPHWSGSPTGLGPDWDFGSAPNLFTTDDGKDCLGAGAKSGIYYSLDPDTGKLNWATQVGPGGTGGGIEWGSAVDGKRIYCAISNSDNQLNSFGTRTGLWAALDAKTGEILWSTPDPIGGHDYGMVTIANGVMFAASAGQKPYPGFAGAPGGLFALDGATGKCLWQFTVANDPNMGSSICGASVVDGVVYWGSGYSHLLNGFGISGPQPTLYAFSLK
jgi:polyvinyl alcohol dehydrogenase (cytochrome)